MVTMDPRTAAPTKQKRGFRPDIQGLRAIAVGLVLIYHAGAPLLTGGFVGVDVFFVISGFLITGLLLKEAATEHRISLAGFYARRARRILPPALLVLLLVGVATIAVLPETRWASIGVEILGSSFNVVNWTFAANSTDYLQGDAAASPLQHFWSLAVEEQFYIVWPLLLVGAIALAHKKSTSRRGRVTRDFDAARFRTFLIIAVVLLTVPSFLFSMYYTEANPGAAYFVTTTRIWELGIGALVAIFGEALAKGAARFSGLLGWIGLAMIAVAGFTISSSTAFPGYAAALPTVGAAAIIVAGMNSKGESGVGRLLAIRPLTWVGDISYSLYLWHWPMIVIGTYLLGGLNVSSGLVIIALSFLPAYASYKYVERPFMEWKFVRGTRSALWFGSVAIMSTAMVGGLVVNTAQTSSVAAAASAYTSEAWSEGGTAKEAPLRGAALLATSEDAGIPTDTVAAYTPSAAAASEDVPKNVHGGCHQDWNQDSPEFCSYGEEEASYEIAVVGDSHAAQWIPAFSRLARDNDILVKTYTKSSCPFSANLVMAEGNEESYDSCRSWNENVMEELTGASSPDLVLVTGQSYLTAGGEPFVDGLIGAWGELRDNGVAFAVLADTPRPGIDVPECVASNADSLTECAVEREKALVNGIPDQRTAAEQMGDVKFIDLTDSICPADKCSPIIGEVLVYRDSNHLTATYASTLASAMGDELAALDVPMGQAE